VSTPSARAPATNSAAQSFTAGVSAAMAPVLRAGTSAASSELLLVVIETILHGPQITPLTQTF
jgi:hypothetical protein